MAKSPVAKAPHFDLKALDFSQLVELMPRYEIVDSNGNYLPWQKFKWRVSPKSETELAWQVVKFKRSMIRKFIPLFDEENKIFYYVPHGSMDAKIHEITRLAGGNVAFVSDGNTTKNLQQRFLVSSLIMEEAITSAQLEGASTTREIAKKMLEDERPPVSEDERMILNNYLLLLYAEKNSDKPLSLDLILDFHRIATSGTSENNVIPGTFREDDKIFVGDGDGGIAHQPPSHTQIFDRLQNLCIFANKNHNGIGGVEFIHPIIKAIILHFMIGYEHPFRDGNGRTARALFYWYMIKSEYSLFKYVSISKLIKDSPRDYGLSFLYSEKDDGDLTFFIDHQLEIIIKSLRELEDYLRQKSNEFHEVVSFLESSKYNELHFIQKDILKKAIKNAGRIFTAKEIASDYGISLNTARSHLSKLEKEKLLYVAKDSKTMLFISPADLNMRLKASDQSKR